MSLSQANDSSAAGRFDQSRSDSDLDLNLSRAYGVAGVCFVSLMFSSIPIFIFSLVLKPIQVEMGWSRGDLSFAPFLFYIVSGVASLSAGRLLDRLGARLVFISSLCVTIISCFLVGLINQLWQLYVIFGLLFPVGSAGVILVVVSALVSNWFTSNRGVMLSVVSTGFSFGQLLAIPAFSLVILAYGWRMAFVPLGAILTCIAIAAMLVVKNKPPNEVRTAPPAATRSGLAEDTGVETRNVYRTSTFWLITVSFFACGFTDYLVTTQLPSFASDLGFYQQSGAYALSIMGGANILGLIVAGKVSDNFGPRITLAFTYLIRLLSMPLLLLTHDVYTLYAFSFVFGLTYFTTGPLTANLVREAFGSTNMGSIFGALGLVHSLAGGSGAYSGGLVFDLTGNYLIAFLAGSLILLVGTATAFVTRVPRERPSVNAGSQPIASSKFEPSNITREIETNRATRI